MLRCISILMVCVDMSQLEPKQKRKSDIICKVTLYSQLNSPHFYSVHLGWTLDQIIYKTCQPWHFSKSASVISGILL